MVIRVVRLAKEIDWCLLSDIDLLSVVPLLYQDVVGLGGILWYGKNGTLHCLVFGSWSNNESVLRTCFPYVCMWLLTSGTIELFHGLCKRKAEQRENSRAERVKPHLGISIPDS